MAKTHAAFLEQSNALKTALKDLEDLWLLKFRKLVNHHNGVAFSDAGDTPKPSYINEDVNGNIDGLDFGRADYISGMTLLNQLENFFTNSAVTQGAYRDTLAKITDSTSS